MMRRIHSEPRPLSTAPSTTTVAPAGVMIAARTLPSVVARRASRATGMSVSTRAESRACALCARCSASTASRARSVAAVRSSGAGHFRWVDDLVLWGTRREAIRGLDALHRAAAGLGLELHPGKTRLLEGPDELRARRCSILAP